MKAPKWIMQIGSKTSWDFTKTVTVDEDGRPDVELFLQFETSDITCHLSLWRGGDQVAEAQEISWEQGLIMLERDGTDSPEVIGELYDHA